MHIFFTKKPQKTTVSLIKKTTLGDCCHSVCDIIITNLTIICYCFLISLSMLSDCSCFNLKKDISQITLWKYKHNVIFYKDLKLQVFNFGWKITHEWFPLCSLCLKWLSEMPHYMTNEYNELFHAHIFYC